MLKPLIITWRLLVILIIAVISAFLSLTVFYIVPLRVWHKMIRIWANLLISASGVKLEVVGQSNHDYLAKNHMLVANHMSWLDILILVSIHVISFVAKAEISKWPVVKQIAAAGSTVFINRENKRDILQANQLIIQELNSGKCVGLFPEGKVNNGKELLSFKSPLLEAAIQAKSKIIPVVLIYYREDGSFAEETLYYGRNLLQTVLNTLGGKNLRAKAFVLPSVESPNFASRHELAVYLHQEMNTIYEREVQRS